VGLSSRSRGHVSLALVVRLVEAEDGLGTVLESLSTVGTEAVGVERLVIPEGRNEVEALETAGVGVPVVTPTTVLTLAGEGVGKVNIVVADTSLVREANGATGRRAGAGLGLLGGGLSLDSLLLEDGLLGGSSSLLGLLLLSSGLGGGLSGLGGLGDLDDGSRLRGSGSGSGRSLGLGSSGGLSSSRSSTTEVVVLPRDDLTVNGSGDPVATLLGVLLVGVTVAEGKSRLKKSGGSGKDGELVGDHLE